MPHNISPTKSSTVDSVFGTEEDFIDKSRLDSNKSTTATVQLPDLFTSVAAQPARLNSCYESNVPKEADEWIRGMMALDDAAFSRHQKFQVPLLAAGFAPEADSNGYRLMCDFLAWNFYFDDIFVEGDLQGDPVGLREEIEAHLAIHEEKYQEIGATEHLVRRLYQAIWKKMQGILSSGAQKRYIEGIRHYFEGCIMQAESYYWYNRRQSFTTFEMFWHGRLHSVGCRPVQALLEPLHLITLSENVWSHPMIKEAENTAAVIIFLHNDIVSYRKERVGPETFPQNTIHVLQIERGYGLQEAFDFSGELLKQAFHRWFWAQQHLPSYGEQIDTEVQRYLEGLLQQVKANLRWSFASGRYFGQDSEIVRRTMTLEMQL